MKEKLSKDQTDAILKALNDALEQGPWDESNFLRAIGRKLSDVRDRFVEHLNRPGSETAKKETQLAHQMALRTNQKLIFVALYSYEGAHLLSWERILMNLPKQMVSRPIYAVEDDVKDMIKIKENKNNEAYLSLYIDQSDILPLSADKTPLDKLGKPLLVLKNKSLHPENYHLFVHTSGTYHYHQGRLVKSPLNENE
jgi:intracellular multiplication protein IcmQ